MSRTTNQKKWTTDELIEILSYINNHSKTSSDSLEKACKKAEKHLHLDRTHKSVYLKVARLIHSVKLWLSDHVQNGEAIIWKDDRVYKLLETICKRLMKNKNEFTEVSSGEQEQGLQLDSNQECVLQQAS